MILMLMDSPVQEGMKPIRNKQCGDWFYNTESITAKVDESLPPDSRFAVAIHELIEAFLCRKVGIPDSVVCDFDEIYEKERDEGKHDNTHEPGDDERSPYRLQHMAATHVERAVCAAIGLNWQAHEKAVEASGEAHP